MIKVFDCLRECVNEIMYSDKEKKCVSDCKIATNRFNSREAVGYDKLSDVDKKFYNKTGLIGTTNPACMLNGGFMCTAPDCDCN